MPHKFYHGRTGRVWNVTKRAVGVEINKQVGNRIIKKIIHVRVEHLQPSRCTEEFQLRKKKKKISEGRVVKRDSFLLASHQRKKSLGLRKPKLAFLKRVLSFDALQIYVLELSRDRKKIQLKADGGHVLKRCFRK
ncbi:hypothetical protein K2173_006490 [Erythroxylum novogranatense]|uniref:60S ribosomal protein L21 n=1 Tax=Erythroxylum novogranatense TaxID=1862640 RepID=A0AAV8SL61_9ROSI|nr:hypothetical protein K2173_006490 [Erythroxylum novogranatense]